MKTCKNCNAMIEDCITKLKLGKSIWSDAYFSDEQLRFIEARGAITAYDTAIGILKTAKGKYEK